MNIEHHLIKTATTGRFLVRHAAPDETRPNLLVGFHGYGENAERHLAELERIPEAGRWTIVAVLALHRFYNTKTNEVVGSWMTRLDRDQAIADNIKYVDDVVGDVRSGLARSPRLVFAGFSQGVAMAYRAAILGAHACDGVIALCGDLPPELRDGTWPRTPRILIGRGRDDTWYTEAKRADDLRALRAQHAHVEHLDFEGGHEWTGEFRTQAGRFLASLGREGE